MKIGTEPTPAVDGSPTKLILVADTRAEDQSLQRLHTQLASDYQVKYNSKGFSLTVELKRKG